MNFDKKIHTGKVCGKVQLLKIGVIEISRWNSFSFKIFILEDCTFHISS
jgi:hypothetical protein